MALIRSFWVGLAGLGLALAVSAHAEDPWDNLTFEKLDQVEAQPAEQMHRLAIAAMSLTAEVVAGQLGLPRVTDLNAATPGVLDISRSSACLAAIAALPCNWTVTSDSIAAAVAASMNAELLLAKSVVPQTSAIPSLVAAGWLDGHFATASNNLSSIRWAAPAMERGGLH